MPGRLWQLLLGASIAVLIAQGKLAVRRSELGASIGLLMVLASVFGFSANTPSPGLYMFAPTFGAALIIVHATHETLVGRLLSGRALVGLGLISYSAYLWHQPIFAFARYRLVTDLSDELKVCLCLVTFLLSYLSWKFVETPLRSKDRLNRKKFFAGAGVLGMLYLGAALLITQMDGSPSRFGGMAGAEPPAPPIEMSCHSADQAGPIERTLCSIGDLTSAAPVNVALFGDSHALAIMPAFATMAKDNGEKFMFGTLSGCPPILGLDVVKGNWSPGVCSNWNEEIFNAVRRQNIKTVILVARWSLYTAGSDDRKPQSGYFLINDKIKENSKEASRQVFTASLDSTLEALRQIGVRVFVVEQIPQQTNDPRLHYLRLGTSGVLGTPVASDFARRLSVELETHKATQKFNRDLFAAAAEKGLTKIINLDPHFCDATACLMGDDEYPFYRDKDHINGWMAIRLVPDLKNALR